MSRKTINAILGLAAVDEAFCRALLANPFAATQTRQFDLTEEEREIFKTISASNLSDLSRQLVTLLDEGEKK
ncbi:MAG TPA: Os1348 family NHLP clan protein [Ktedonobacteraceae bacterium]|nr:Os1348 family NHLP clan protein [Ktedonobacteraceae bacterium]